MSLPKPESIPRTWLNRLRICDAKPILQYYNRHISPSTPSRIPTNKQGIIDALKKCLEDEYRRKNRAGYDELVGYLIFSARKKSPRPGLYERYQWHNRETYPIPTSGSWASFDSAVSTQPSPLAPRRYVDTTGVPSAVPGGLVNAQYLHSPAAEQANGAVPSPAQATSQAAVDLTNVVFSECGLLLPSCNAAQPTYCPPSSRLHTQSIRFKLPEEQISLLTSDEVDTKQGQSGVFLYMANFTTSISQHRKDPKKPLALNNPQRLQVRVNGVQVKMPVDTPYACKVPLRLTQLLYTTSDLENTVSISYASSSAWIAAVVQTTHHTPQSMAQYLRRVSLVTADQVRQRFLKAMASDDDDLIPVGALVNLKCPLGLCRIKVPSRSTKCQHSQCFDCETFLQFYMNKSAWTCPVCSVDICGWRDLIIDGYFEGILQKTPDSDDQVYVEPNGDWKPKDAVEMVRVQMKKPGSRSLEAEDDGTIDVSDSGESVAQATSQNKRRRLDVVDLTLDSDSDDGEETGGLVVRESSVSEVQFNVAARAPGPSSAPATPAHALFTPQSAGPPPALWAPSSQQQSRSPVVGMSSTFSSLFANAQPSNSQPSASALDNDRRATSFK
ncbi:E3 SUMO-protein ligase pli1 [Coemansia sp. RSA 552]|nr:E3 SUMO-protein ligase pli1 [Coemansia sp. RSA 552]